MLITNPTYHLLIYSFSAGIGLFLLVFLGFNRFIAVRSFYKWSKMIAVKITYIFIVTILVISLTTLVLDVLVLIMLPIANSISDLFMYAAKYCLYIMLDLFVFMVPIAAVYFPLILCAKLNKNPLIISCDYERGGRLGKWSRATSKYMSKIGWLNRISQNLISSGLLPVRDNLIIAAPTANAGNRENHLGEYIAAACNNKVTVFASDLARLKDHAPTSRSNSLDFIYTEGVDAKNLDRLLEDNGQSEVDVIWDIKGYLWYSKNKEQTLKGYYDLLSPGGIIILEAHKNNLFLIFINDLFLQVFGKIISYVEDSTYFKITKIYQKSSALQELFDEILISDSDHTNCDIAIYRKKG